MTKIQARIVVEGEPVYADIVDIVPAPPERGGYLLIVAEPDRPFAGRRKYWFPDPAETEVAVAAEAAQHFRREEDRIREESRRAEQRLNNARSAARARQELRRRDVEDIPEESAE